MASNDRAACSFVLTRTLTTLLYGIASHDPLTAAATAATVMPATLAACRVDPLIALRYE